MEARRDTAFAAAARDKLEHAAAAVDFARIFAPSVINELQSLPQLVELPTDAHELLAAVAGLLGPDSELRTVHEPGAYQEDESGFGCGCGVLITHDGEVWSLHRTDSVWTMTREGDYEEQADGSWIELTATPTTTHPQHLVAEIRMALRTSN
ncbi:hypothetical protein ACPXCP_39140 [Streptomyces sp. DT20]|uniref:hypothetical protein n=1 Tax=Streptomyces sp. DT20 TaxID=3416519 RepID=UPI003CEF3A92